MPNYGHGYLKRLSREAYLGLTIVHWSMTIEKRRTGWLTPLFHSRFREVLTHACHRYRFCCLVYCLMPDHLHVLLAGMSAASDQLLAARFLRTHLNEALQPAGVQLQKQGYDHVIRQHDPNSLDEVFGYIARNPERAGLVSADACWTYEYTGCLMPGFPRLMLGRSDSSELFWRLFEQGVSKERNSQGPAR